MMRMVKENQKEAQAYTRYIDASAHPDWEQRAVNWVAQGIEPEF